MTPVSAIRSTCRVVADIYIGCRLYGRQIRLHLQTSDTSTIEDAYIVYARSTIDIGISGRRRHAAAIRLIFSHSADHVSL